MTPEPPPPATARDLILIIDDDRGILRCLQRALQDTGRFEALICDNPLEAVTLADAHHPAAILLDLIMPQAPGEEILARLKAQTPEIPVLIVTAMDEIPSPSAASRPAPTTT